MALTKIGFTLIKDNFKDSVSGSSTAQSSSFSTRVTTAETELENTLLSGSAQIATNISGSLGANATVIRNLSAAVVSGSSVSSSDSVSARVVSLEGSGTIQGVGTTNDVQFTNITGSEVSSSTALFTTATIDKIGGAIDFNNENMTNVDIDSGTITGITDLVVTDGGTGVSTLTDGGVLLGSGTDAITAMAVLTDGQMIVGDGSTDPVAESGATLRTSIGVGLTDDVVFSEISGSNTTLTGHISASGEISSSSDLGANGDLYIGGDTNLSGHISASGEISSSSGLGADGNLYIGGTSNFAGDVTLQSDLVVTGRIDAEEIHTTFISSSITQATGSNIFGDAKSDLHQFTGSVDVSGSLTLRAGDMVVSDTLNATNIGAFKAAGAIDFDNQNMTNVDIDSGTITGITDITVADGGTGVSTLTDGGVLLGSGTSAITAMAVLTDGQMIVGDGTTDPVAESGATLRTSIGVGTTNDVKFANITGSNVSASVGKFTTATINNITGNTTSSGDLGTDGDLYVGGRITGSSGATFVGNVGIGTTAPDGPLHVHTATAGSVTADSSADDLVVETGGSGGISILTPAANQGEVAFGDPDDNNVGRFAYNHPGDYFALVAGTSEIMRISGSGNVILQDNPARLGVGADVDQRVGGSFDVIQVGHTSQWYAETGNAADRNVYIGNNFYHDGSNHKAIYEDQVSGIQFRAGTIRFNTTSSVATSVNLEAGGGRERMRISADGNVFIKTEKPAPTNSQSLPGYLQFEGLGWDTNSGSDPIGARITMGGSYSGITSGGVIPHLAFSIQNSGDAGATSETMDEHMRLIGTGALFMGDNTNANLTKGICINQGANDDEIMAFKSSDVNHSGTSVLEADTYAAFSKTSGVNGGLMITGVTEGTYRAIQMQVTTMGATNATKSTGGYGVVDVDVHQGDFGGVSTNGNLMSIGAGNTTRFLFDNEGSGHADVEWVTYSDGRLKKNVEDIPYGLNELNKLEPKIYDRYSGKLEDGKVKLEDNSFRQIGFIAQDVKKIIPELIKDIDESESFYSLDDGKLVSVLVKAVQELSEKIKHIEKTCKCMKNGET